MTKIFAQNFINRLDKFVEFEFQEMVSLRGVRMRSIYESYLSVQILAFSPLCSCTLRTFHVTPSLLFWVWSFIVEDVWKWAGFSTQQNLCLNSCTSYYDGLVVAHRSRELVVRSGHRKELSSPTSHHVFQWIEEGQSRGVHDEHFFLSRRAASQLREKHVCEIQRSLMWLITSLTASFLVSQGFFANAALADCHPDHESGLSMHLHDAVLVSIVPLLGTITTISATWKSLSEVQYLLAVLTPRCATTALVTTSQKRSSRSIDEELLQRSILDWHIFRCCTTTNPPDRISLRLVCCFLHFYSWDSSLVSTR